MSADLPVYAVRVTFLPNRLEPWIEVWMEDEDKDVTQYPYFNINPPFGLEPEEVEAALEKSTTLINYLD